MIEVYGIHLGVQAFASSALNIFGNHTTALLFFYPLSVINDCSCCVHKTFSISNISIRRKNPAFRSRRGSPTCSPELSVFYPLWLIPFHSIYVLPSFLFPVLFVICRNHHQLGLCVLIRNLTYKKYLTRAFVRLLLLTFEPLPFLPLVLVAQP